MLTNLDKFPYTNFKKFIEFWTNFHTQILDKFSYSNFGQIFILEFWANFHPKKPRYESILVLWTIILDFYLF
jgi:hypothetical protein